MAFKLTNGDIKERDNMIGSVQDKQQTLTEAITKFNDVIEEQKSAVEDCLNDLNGAISDLRNFIEQKRDEFQGEFDDKSEKWQEGDRARAIADWIGTFDNVSLEDAQIEFPELLEEVVIDGLNEIENLEAEPSY
jgi:phage-related protein